MLIRAFADVRGRFPSAHLVLIGEGDERPSLERLVASLDLAGAVTLLGDRPDAVGLMAQFDVFALSSEFEGSPLALIEAMWWSRPIVATSVGGIPEMIVDGESGLLVRPGRRARWPRRSRACSATRTCVRRWARGRASTPSRCTASSAASRPGRLSTPSFYDRTRRGRADGR